MQDGFILVLNTLSGDISFIDPKDDSVVEETKGKEGFIILFRTHNKSLLSFSFFYHYYNDF